jgi:tetratricopeptide (TPR) repeat protein
VLDDLEGRTDDRDDLDRVQLLRGRTLEAMGAFEDAISTYEEISASHKRSEASAEGHYRTGLIHRDEHELLDEAAESFRKAREEAPRTDVAKLAADASEDVATLAAFLQTIEESERDELEGSPETEGSAGAAGGGTGAAGHETASVDTATALEETPADTVSQTPDAPADTVSQLPFNTIDSLSEFPVTPIDSLHVFSGGPVDSLSVLSGAPAPDEGPETGRAAATVDSIDAVPEVDPTALAHFRAAEIYLFRFDDHERATRHYSAVIADHPDCALVPKAALALAWILEERVGDAVGAREAYEAVIADYPDTEFAEGAAKALERMSQSDADE